MTVGWDAKSRLSLNAPRLLSPPLIYWGLVEDVKLFSAEEAEVVEMSNGIPN